MTAYYNENDPNAAAWLRELIRQNVIAPGDVDERSIADVRPNDLRGYTQCHFFAGIGGWSRALRLSGWSDDRPVWTGSCPCQPFSAAGEGRGFDDERHLWPAWFYLIAQRKPEIVFGEQVSSKAALAWLDVVQTDMENTGYAFWAADLCSAGVGAPHIRQRLYYVGDARSAGSRWDTRSILTAEIARQGIRHADRSVLDLSIVAGSTINVADAVGERCGRIYPLLRRDERGRQSRDSSEITGSGSSSDMADTDGGNESAEREQRSGQYGQLAQDSGVSAVEHSASNGRIDRRAESSERSSVGGCGESSMVDAASEQARVSGCARIAGITGAVGNSDEQQLDGSRDFGSRGWSESSDAGFWDNCEWIECTDGKARPIEPGTFPLAHGVHNRVGLLRGYGNAITPQVAQAFIESVM